MGCYLSFSRGALACLRPVWSRSSLLARTARQLRAARVALGAGALAGARRGAFGGGPRARRRWPRASARARSCSRSLVARSPPPRRSPRRARCPTRRSPCRRGRARGGRRRDRRCSPTSPSSLAERGGPSARRRVRRDQRTRFATLGSNRYGYWRVALDVGADHPLAGVGAGGFRVEWLRRRTIDERVRDAHSLELETFAELGLVGARAARRRCSAASALAARRALRADRALAAGPAAAALTLGPARRPRLGLGDARRHPRRGRPRRAAALPGRRGGRRSPARR